MLRECSLRVAALGALGVLILGPVAAGAQSAARSRSAPTQTTTAAKKNSLEPKAIEVLKAVGSRLAAAHTLSVVAVETVESLSRRSEVTLQRPDKLRVIVFGDRTPQSQSYCNGNTMMTYSPDKKALVIAKAPPTLNECLKDAYQASAIDFPLIDLIVVDPNRVLIPGLTHAAYIGQAQVVGETTTDIVTYSGDNVFVKMWVGTQDKLPRRLQVVYRDDPNRLRRRVAFSDWKIDVPVRPEVFTSLRTDSPDRLDSAEPRPVGTSGLQRAPKVRPLTLHTYSAKYWGSGAPTGLGFSYSNYYGGTAPAPGYGAGGYYQSPDGYTYYSPANYGAYPPVGYYGAPCYDCGPDDWATEGAAEDAAASFNLSLSTSGWYNAVPAPGFSQTIPNVTMLPPFEVGQIMTTLPVG